MAPGTIPPRPRLPSYLYLLTLLASLISLSSLTSASYSPAAAGADGRAHPAMNFIARSTVLEEDAGNLVGLTKRRFTNLQTFQGALGDLAAGAITQSGDGERPFLAGGDTFDKFDDAATRTCDDQFNNCADKANAGEADFEVGDCDTQNNRCKATQAQAQVKSFAVAGTGSQQINLGPAGDHPGFDIVCDA